LQKTLNRSQFSLYGGSITLSWSRANGTTHTTNRTLPVAYSAGVIPSLSYGLHVGSAAYGVAGSLCLGGYDSSRIIDKLLTVQNSTTVTVSALALNVSSGSPVYANITASQLPLSIPLGGDSGLEVKPDPGVPYMYFPKLVCDSIAAHLPVDYDPGLGLYIWRSNAATTSKMLSSPHHLSFSFANSDTRIAVPLALLNLTLTNPISATPRHYFPCSPYEPPAGDNSYTLGRAFLQAAFLGQNWETGTLWLAQAPGPRAPLAASVKRIAPADRSLVAAADSAGWQDSWAGALKPLSAEEAREALAGGSGGGGSDPSRSSSGGGLPAGGAAGVAVGVAGAAILGICAAALFVWRRRRAQRRAEGLAAKSGQGELAGDQCQPTELAGELPRGELPEQLRSELYGGDVFEAPDSSLAGVPESKTLAPKGVYKVEKAADI
jgi:hypothetical protein